MLDLYEIYSQPEKLIWYDKYGLLIHELIDSGEDYKVIRSCDAIRHIIKKSPSAAYVYARYVIKGRWHEAEKYILTDPEWTLYYAVDVIKDRWIEAEPFLINFPNWAYKYSLHIIKGRFYEAEECIKTKPFFIYMYAKHVIKDRWIEAEQYIMKDPRCAWWTEYKQAFNI